MHANRPLWLEELGQKQEAMSVLLRIFLCAYRVLANGIGQVHAGLAGSDTGVFCTEVPEPGDCSGCYVDDEVVCGDEGVTAPDGLPQFDRCRSH